MKWHPIKTMPSDGKFLVAVYAPTDCSYWITTVNMNASYTHTHREMSLRYARAWAKMPKEPMPDIND